MSILVIAEHDNSQLKPVTLNALQAAAAIAATENSAIDVLLAGESCGTVAEQLSAVAGVAQVLVVDDSNCAHQLAENVAPLVAGVVAEKGYSHVLMSASTTGKNLIPRVAALLDVQPISDIIAVVSADTFKRPIYAGNVIATVQSADTTKLITVRSAAFDAVDASGGNAEVVAMNGGAVDAGISSFVKQELSVSERPELTSASVVVSGGRGMGSAENFALIDKLADKLGAAVGASRAAVDAGYVANDMQVGQTGKIVAPDLYIAVGISGAIQHLAGMKDSKVIVAINKDAEAPIFQVADYGLVADLFDVLPELESKL